MTENKREIAVIALRSIPAFVTPAFVTVALANIIP